MTLRERLTAIAVKVGELHEYIAELRGAVCHQPPGERDSILLANVTAQLDLVNHIAARLAAVIAGVEQ